MPSGHAPLTTEEAGVRLSRLLRDVATVIAVAVQVRVAGLAADERDERERGDVPGWVMVTVMTAGLVVAVFGVFRGAIIAAVQNAINSVVSGTGG